MIDPVPDSVWFASAVVCYREKGSTRMRIVVTSFGVSALTVHKARGAAEAICDQMVSEITDDNPGVEILGISAVVNDSPGAAGVVADLTPVMFAKPTV